MLPVSICVLRKQASKGWDRGGWTPWQAEWGLLSWGLKGGMAWAHELGDAEVMVNRGGLGASASVKRSAKMDRPERMLGLSRTGRWEQWDE